MFSGQNIDFPISGGKKERRVVSTPPTERNIDRRDFPISPKPKHDHKDFREINARAI